jgi:hypothetical protein
MKPLSPIDLLKKVRIVLDSLYSQCLSPTRGFQCPPSQRIALQTIFNAQNNFFSLFENFYAIRVL